MKCHLLHSLILSLVVLLSSVVLAAENTVADLNSQILQMEKDLATTRPDLIKKFMEKYLHPSDFEKIKADETYDEIVRDFIKQRRKTLAKALHQIARQSPIVDPDGLHYQFNLKPDSIPDLPKNDVRFVYDPETRHFYIHD